MGFIEGFERECGERVRYTNCELRSPVEGDELIIFITFMVDGTKRAMGAIGYHLPDTCANYEELGQLCARQVKDELPPVRTVLHHSV